MTSLREDALTKALYQGRLGYLEVSISSIALTVPGKSLYVDSIAYRLVSDEEVMVERSVPIKSLLSHMDLTVDPIEIKCVYGWDLEIALVCAQKCKSKIKRILLTSLDISTISSQSTTIACQCTDVSNTHSLSVTLSLQFFPNLHCYLVLAQRGAEREDFTAELINEMRNLTNSGKRYMNRACSEQILSALEVVQQVVGQQLPDDSAACPSSSSSPVQQVSGSMEMYEIAQMLRVVLTDLSVLLPMAPKVTINLVEKIISLYRTCKGESQLSVNGPQSSPNGNSPGQASSSSGHQRTIFRALSPKGTPSTSRRQVFSVEDAHILRLSACLWYLQQSLIHANLLNEFEITVQELSALWSMFDRYDPTLSSEISWSDMPLLFEDLKQDYSPKEMASALKGMDSDQIGLVGFADFLRWWCES